MPKKCKIIFSKKGNRYDSYASAWVQNDDDAHGMFDRKLFELHNQKGYGYGQYGKLVVNDINTGISGILLRHEDDLKQFQDDCADIFDFEYFQDSDRREALSGNW